MRVKNWGACIGCVWGQHFSGRRQARVERGGGIWRKRQLVKSWNIDEHTLWPWFVDSWLVLVCGMLLCSYCSCFIILTCLWHGTCTVSGLQDSIAQPSSMVECVLHTLRGRGYLLMTPSWRGEAARCKSCGFRTWCKSQRRWMHCTGQVKNGNGWSWVKGQDVMLKFRVCA